MSPKLSRNTRLKVITKHLTTCKYEEIAQLCGVTERTIQRDIKRWKKNGGFQDFLLKEFFETYGVIKLIDNKFAFTRICDLMRLNKTLFGLEETEGIDGYKISWKETDSAAFSKWMEENCTEAERKQLDDLTRSYIRFKNKTERSTLH